MNSRAVLLAGCLLLATGCAPAPAPPAARDEAPPLTRSPFANESPARDTLWLLGPDSTRDAVRAADTESTLVRRYGQRNVRRGRIELEEGDSEDGTILFPGDSSLRVEILWEGTVGRSKPVRAMIGPSRSRWFVVPGITIGTSLEALHRLNGGPFEMTGLEGHSPGLVTDWRGGALALLSGRVVVRLASGIDVGEDNCPGYGELQTGWGKLSSHRAMGCAGLTVYSIEVVPR